MSRSITLASVVISLLLAAWLRIYRIDYQSYWNDEGNSRGLAGRSAAAIWQQAAGDIHPPGYYLLLKAWRAAAGESELALRGLSALAGVVTVALIYRLGRAYFDRPAALAAALAGAFNPFLVYYGQEARNYALLAALSAASFLLFTLWLRSSRPPGPAWGDPRLGLGYSLATAAGLYTHYAFGFVAAAQNLAALGGLLAHRTGTPRRRRFAAWLGWQALAGALYLPWAPIAWRQLTTWPAAREFGAFGESLRELGRYLTFGRTLPADDPALLAGLLGALALLVFGLRRRGQTITPLLWLLVPAGLTLGFGLLSEAFAKFLLVAVPALCLLLGQGLAGVPVGEEGRAQGARRRAQGRRARSAGKRGSGGAGVARDKRGRLWARLAELPFLLVWLAALGAVLYGTYASLNHLYFDPAFFRDDYRGIAQRLAAAYRPGDAVITIAPNQVEAFGYYHQVGAPVYPLPSQRPLDRAQTEAALAEIAAVHPRLFVLFWGQEQADPEGVVESWLNTHAYKAGDEWFGQVRLATYAAAAPASGMETAVDADFGDGIRLLGYTLAEEAVAPGDILQLTLFWQADTQPQARYKVFVHVYTDETQPPVAQHDSEPAGNLAPTTTWQPGMMVADNHGVRLPADLPAGEYSLWVGLYDLFTNVNRPVMLDGERVGERLLLQTIAVRPPP